MVQIPRCLSCLTYKWYTYCVLSTDMCPDSARHIQEVIFKKVRPRRFRPRRGITSSSVSYAKDNQLPETPQFELLTLVVWLGEGGLGYWTAEVSGCLSQRAK